NNLALLYSSQANYVQAESLYRQAIAAFRIRGDDRPLSLTRLAAGDLKVDPNCVSIIGNYSRYLQQQLGPRPSAAQLRGCDQAFALTIDLLDRLRQEVVASENSKIQHGAGYFYLFPHRLGVLQGLFALEGKVNDLETAFATAEQGTARAFLESLGK